MAEPQLVVMAAGIGSRYGGLKQIDPVGPSGEIVLDYAIYDAIRAGFKKVVFIIRKEIEDVFREKVGHTIDKQIETAYVFQELDKLPPGFSVPEGRTKPWGTGHAILCAREAVTGPCAVINADDFYGPDSFRVLGEYLRNAQDADGLYDFSMVGFVLNNTLTEHGHVARGICTSNADGYLENVVERTKIQRFGQKVRFTEDDKTWTDINKASTVSMNFWGLTPVIFDELANRFPAFLEANTKNLKAELFIPTIINDLIQEGKARVKILPTTDSWFGVTYQEDKPRLKEEIQNKIATGEYPENLWALKK